MTFFDEYHAGHVDRAYDVSAAAAQVQRLTRTVQEMIAVKERVTKMQGHVLQGDTVSLSCCLSGDGAFKASPAQPGQRRGESRCVQELQRRGGINAREMCLQKKTELCFRSCSFTFIPYCLHPAGTTQPV